ncbi:hypothetical protein [Nocardioides lacusdianchii]|uniref:hypothetical protein n=1 Tax=Nocardioides lacusdianchii TaxID=2783664 RepID=UPI001CD007FE|nr:hypothetical protein [Nocardioides lacusdianchii]
MTVDVDDARIRDRVAQRRQQRRDGVDLWVELDGLDQPAGVVRAAVNQIDDGARRWEVRPTTGGAWTWLSDMADWHERVLELAAVLSGMGHAGSISVPWVDPLFHRGSDVPFPTAYLTHRVDPLADAGPFNAHGVPEPRWGVSESATERLLTHAVAWALVPGTGAHVGDVVRTPVQEHDAVSLISPLLDRRLSNLALASTSRAGGELRRSVGFSPFGQTWWIDLDRDADPTALAEHTQGLLLDHAPDLQFGAVHLTYPGTDESEATTTSVWRRHPHLWSAYVPDAFGVQLVTGRHLAHAHDLSQWHVTEVAEDRWLVAARDLAAWFRPPEPSTVRSRQFPDPALRARAREDFGAMILTRETAAAHRPQR